MYWFKTLILYPFNKISFKDWLILALSSLINQIKSQTEENNVRLRCIIEELETEFILSGSECVSK